MSFVRYLVFGFVIYMGAKTIISLTRKYKGIKNTEKTKKNAAIIKNKLDEATIDVSDAETISFEEVEETKKNHEQ